MFKKILVAEDYESLTISVKKALDDLKVENTHFVYYCDDAIERIKIAELEKDPYDLLITDLSFDEDYRIQKIKSGVELIKEAKTIQQSLKVIVFSVEKNPNLIDNLFNNYGINAVVSKGREDTKELKKAIDAVFNKEKHLSADLQNSIKSTNSYEFTMYDITLVTLLSQGVYQKNIPSHCAGRDRGISP